MRKRRCDKWFNLDDTVRLAGELLLISSKTGRLLNVSFVPDQMESYYSPQLLRRSSSEQYILVGTGGETHGGGLYAFNVRCWKRLCASPVRITDTTRRLIVAFARSSTRKSSAMSTKVWWPLQCSSMWIMIRSRISSFLFTIPHSLPLTEKRSNNCGTKRFLVLKRTGECRWLLLRIQGCLF